MSEPTTAVEPRTRDDGVVRGSEVASRGTPPARTARTHRRRPRPASVLGRVLLVVAGLAMALPFAWSLLTSLQDSRSLLVLPPSFSPSSLTTSAYRRLVDLMPFTRIVANTVIVTIISTVAQVVTSAMAGYGLARFNFRGRHAVFLAYLATMMVPFQVTIIPLFIAMRWLGWVNSLQALIAPMVASAFGVFLFRQYFMQMPAELEEAAALDGANPWQTFWRIALPYAQPAIAAHGILAFMAAWNAFLWPLFIARDESAMTLPVALASLHGRWTTDWSLVMAGSVITVVPVIVVYAVAQRWIVGGTLLSGIRR
ncbi:MAG: carbohydrate ABC transporter permease [Actinobacteria bacterium]|nr:carbohydrate ABC transporter permease [Actinomycetota bacterium]